MYAKRSLYITNILETIKTGGYARRVASPVVPPDSGNTT